MKNPLLGAEIFLADGPLFLQTVGYNESNSRFSQLFCEMV